MRLGLWIFLDDPTLSPQQITDLLDRQDIPFAGFTDEKTVLFHGGEDRVSFLFRVSEAIFRGMSIPATLLMKHLGGDATPGNVLRRYLEWQLNLRPYLSPVETIEEGDGCFRLGNALLICPLNEMGAVDAQLPPGQWTDMVTGEVVSGTFRRLRSPNAMPILAAEGAVIPTGEETCPTLHWYQPAEEVTALMHREPYHLIIHQDGVETCLR